MPGPDLSPKAWPPSSSPSGSHARGRRPHHLDGGAARARGARHLQPAGHPVRRLGGAQSLSEAYREKVGLPITQAWGMTETSPVASSGHIKSTLAAVLDDDAKADLRTTVEPAAVRGRARIVQPGSSRSSRGTASRRVSCTGARPVDRVDLLRRRAGLRVVHRRQVAEDRRCRHHRSAGYIQLRDRTKDVIKSGGEWISSVELENEIMAHPAVAEAAVIGLPHPKWSERRFACVVLREGEEATRDEILAFLDGRVAKWWLPDDVVFVEEIPKTSVGKFSKGPAHAVRRSRCRRPPSSGAVTRPPSGTDRAARRGKWLRGDVRSYPCVVAKARFLLRPGGCCRTCSWPCWSSRWSASASGSSAAWTRSAPADRVSDGAAGRRSTTCSPGDEAGVGDARFRQVTATGTYDDGATVVVRNRSQDGVAGAWLVTPLILDDGTQVGVLRGFVALGGDGSAVQAAVPEEVTVEGLVVDPGSFDGAAPKDLAPLLAEEDMRRGLVLAETSTPPEPGGASPDDVEPGSITVVRRPSCPRARTSATPPSGSSSRRSRSSGIRSCCAGWSSGGAEGRRRPRRASRRPAASGRQALDAELDELLRQGADRRRLRRGPAARRRIIEAAGACIERRDRIDHRRGHRPAGRRRPGSGVPVVPRRCDELVSAAVTRAVADFFAALDDEIGEPADVATLLERASPRAIAGSATATLQRAAGRGRPDRAGWPR